VKGDGETQEDRGRTMDGREEEKEEAGELEKRNAEAFLIRQPDYSDPLIPHHHHPTFDYDD
jgi:hypothetical protein